MADFQCLAVEGVVSRTGMLCNKEILYKRGELNLNEELGLSKLKTD